MKNRSCCIFVRSYQKDFQWLDYLLRSIQKYCTGFSEVIIAVPEQDAPLLSHLTAETVIGVHDGKPSYLAQQSDKMSADIHTQADYILHLDSDMVITRPLTPDYFFKNGKPIWSYGRFDEESRHAWFGVMAKALEQCPPWEFMRKCAILMPRWLYPSLREEIQRLHKMTLQEYIMSQPGHAFSEYNVAGMHAYTRYFDEFYWHDVNLIETSWPFKQHWSWGGLTPEIESELTKITQ